MTEDEIGLAGEYVLGTLPAAERATASARAAGDPAFAGEVRAWERRLAPLLLSAPDVRPSDMVWPRIEHRIGGGRAAAAPVAGRGAGPWRIATFAATAAAAAFAGVLVLRPEPAAPPPRIITVAAAPQPLTVASLSEGGAKTGLLLTIDEKTGEVFAQPVGLDTPEGKSLELWTIVGTAAPRSLGLIDPAVRGRFQLNPGEAKPGSKFAISVEPPGGSPGAAPSGPITFLGEAVRLPARS